MRTNGTRIIGSAQSSARFDGGALGFSWTGAPSVLGGAALDTTGGAGGGVQVFSSGWPATAGAGTTGRTASGAGGGVVGRTAGAVGATAGRTTTAGLAIAFPAAPTGVRGRTIGGSVTAALATGGDAAAGGVSGTLRCVTSRASTRGARDAAISGRRRANTSGRRRTNTSGAAVSWSKVTVGEPHSAKATAAP